jgi:hypothetical protein
MLALAVCSTTGLCPHGRRGLQLLLRQALPEGDEIDAGHGCSSALVAAAHRSEHKSDRSAYVGPARARDSVATEFDGTDPRGDGGSVSHLLPVSGLLGLSQNGYRSELTQKTTMGADKSPPAKASALGVGVVPEAGWRFAKREGFPATGRASRPVHMFA